MIFEELSNDEKVRVVTDILGILKRPAISIINRKDFIARSSYRDIQITRIALEILSLDELLFVSAHELAHIECQHIQKSLRFIAYLDKKVFRLAKDPSCGFFKKMFKLVSMEIKNARLILEEERRSEFEADKKAIQKLYEVGYDKSGGIKVMERLEKMGDGLGISHPLAKHRKKAIESL